MDATLQSLAFATLAFVGGHFLLSSAPVRGPLAGMIGEGPFRGVYAILMAAALVWMVDSFRFAPHVELWDAYGIGLPIVYVFMFFAAILLVCSLTTRNPTLAGMDRAQAGLAPGGGIYAVTRHPMLAAFVLWAAGHLILSGHLAGLLFFGGMFVLAAGGMAHIDARHRARGSDVWRVFEAGTSRTPFRAIVDGRADFDLAAIGWWRIAVGIALFAGFLFGHGPVMGIYLAGL